MAKLISKTERSTYIPDESVGTEQSATITIPKEWVKICGFKKGEKANAFLMYGKHGYFIAFAPKIQIKNNNEFVTADNFETAKDEKLSESKDSE